MSSPFFSELTKLDGSLRTIQAQVDRMRSGLDDNDDQLKHSVAEACQHASALRDLLRAEDANAKWTDRAALEHLILALEIAADEKRIAQRRTKLVELANELEAGSIKHRVSARAESLNELRVKAVAQLRDVAARKEQDKELPGPEASQWVHWVCNLEEEKDAAVLAELRENFSALDELAGSIEESFWAPGKPDTAVAATIQPPAVPKAEPPVVAKTESPAVAKTEAPAVLTAQPPAPPEGGSPAVSVVKPSVPPRISIGPLPQDVKAHFEKAVRTGDLSEALSLCYDAPASEAASEPQTGSRAEVNPPEQPPAVAASKASLPVTEVPPALKYCEECGGTYPSRYKVCPIDGRALKDLPDLPSEPASAVSSNLSSAHTASEKYEASVATTAAVEGKASSRQEVPAPSSDVDAKSSEDQAVVPVPEFGSASSNFGELTLSKKPPVATWVAAAVLIVACGVFLWMHFRGSNSAKAANSVPNAAAGPDSQAAGADKPLLHREAAEGAQDNILLSMENCERANASGIECWGYISNQRDKDSKISLYRVNAIDGKGNSFDLTSKGQVPFADVHDFTVPAQSKVKYSIKVPDNDKEARTLTLYLDVANPHGSEYTFRDVPVSD